MGVLQLSMGTQCAQNTVNVLGYGQISVILLHIVIVLLAGLAIISVQTQSRRSDYPNRRVTEQLISLFLDSASDVRRWVTEPEVVTETAEAMPGN